MQVYYIAIEPKCGCHTAVAVYDLDDPNEAKNMAKDFADWRRSGRTVVRCNDREAAITNFKTCAVCHPKRHKAQEPIPLFGGPND